MERKIFSLATAWIDPCWRCRPAPRRRVARRCRVIPGARPPQPGRTLTITGMKIWIDNHNLDNTRPETTLVRLLRDGSVIDSIHVDSFGDGRFSFPGLPVTGPDGHEYRYALAEANTPFGYAAAVEGTTITNTLVDTVILRGTKVWADDDNAFGTRPALAAFVVRNASGEAVRFTTVAEGAFAFAPPLPIYAMDGSIIPYRIKESEASPQYIVAEAESTFTNTLDTVEITGSKVWNDENNQAGVRPASVVIHLMQNGAPFWSRSFPVDENPTPVSFVAPRVDPEGVPYLYTLDEANVPAGYEKSVSGHMITNTILRFYVTVVYIEIQNNQPVLIDRFQVLFGGGITIVPRSLSGYTVINPAQQVFTDIREDITVTFYLI